MIVVCSVHGKRDSKKLASLYSRWLSDSGTWERWKIKCCATAYTELMAPFQEISDSNLFSNAFACSVCGDSSSIPANQIFVTSFLPGRDQKDSVALTCNSCANQLQECLRANGEVLIDRGGSVGASASGPNTPDPWDEIK